MDDRERRQYAAEVFKEARARFPAYMVNPSKAARAASISPTLLGVIESGREVMKNPQIYVRLCNLYNLDVQRFFEGIDLKMPLEARV